MKILVVLAAFLVLGWARLPALDNVQIARNDHQENQGWFYRRPLGYGDVQVKYIGKDEKPTHIKNILPHQLDFLW